MVGTNLQNQQLTLTIPLLERNCSRGSTTVPAVLRLGIEPRITASQTRNKTRGMAVPKTIAVLQAYTM